MNCFDQWFSLPLCVQVDVERCDPTPTPTQTLTPIPTRPDPPPTSAQQPAALGRLAALGISIDKVGELEDKQGRIGGAIQRTSIEEVSLSGEESDGGEESDEDIQVRISRWIQR